MIYNPPTLDVNDPLVDAWLKQYPQIKRDRFVLTEKLSGRQFQWHINPHTDPWLTPGSKTHKLKLADKVCTVPVSRMMSRDYTLLQSWLSMALEHRKSLTFFGQLIGPSVSDIPYQGTDRILYFGMAVDGQSVPWSIFSSLLPRSKQVPILQQGMTLGKAMTNKSDNDSWLTERGVKMDGIIIQPMTSVYTRGHQIFRLAKSNVKGSIGNEIRTTTTEDASRTDSEL